MCDVTARVFVDENKVWKIRRSDLVSLEEVLCGMKANGSISRAAADCRALAMHIVTKHVPVYNAAEREPQLYQKRQVGKIMGGISQANVQLILSRACEMLSRLEYANIYYGVLFHLRSMGYELWALPRDFTQPKRA